MTRARLVPAAVSAAIVAILALLVLLPLGVLAIGSLVETPPRALEVDLTGAGLQNYAAVLWHPALPVILRNTLLAAALGTGLAVAIGTGLAWTVVRSDVPLKRLLDLAAIMPMFLSPLVGALAWSALGSPQVGLINLAMKSLGLETRLNVYSLGGIIFVLAIYYAPYVYLYVSSVLKSMDPLLEDAATIHGASRRQMLVRVTLPLMVPALASSSVLVLVLILQLFAIPAVLGQPANITLLAPYIYDLMAMTPSRVNEAAALGMLLLVVTVGLVGLQQWLMGRRRYVTVAGKGLRPKTIALGPWRPLIAGLGVAYVAVAVVLPYSALLVTAFRKNMFLSSVADLFRVEAFGLVHWAFLAENPTVVRAVVNSLLVGFGASLLGGVLYVVISYAVVKAKVPGHRVIDVLVMAPLAIPGILIGLGFLWAWITLPIGIYGTLWILVLAYVTQFAPQGVRATATSLLQVHEELEESARVHGASQAATLRRVMLPLIRHGVFATLVFLFVLSVRELATALFLYTTDSVVLSVVLFDFWARGTEGPMAALALVQTLLLVAAVAISRRVLRSGVTVQ